MITSLNSSASSGADYLISSLTPPTLCKGSIVTATGSSGGLVTPCYNTIPPSSSNETMSSTFSGREPILGTRTTRPTAPPTALPTSRPTVPRSSRPTSRPTSHSTIPLSPRPSTDQVPHATSTSKPADDDEPRAGIGTGKFLFKRAQQL